MSKAILLVRVSTERQDFDEQERELYNLALADGFSDSEIVPICEKESGIKLKEDERKGLNRMKEIIREGGVSVVYAWEVSRIGRKKKVIFSIVDFLIENKVNLIVKEPYLKLLNADGTVNDGAETILTLYAQIAESEMRTKQVRWSRTRKDNAKKGKWNGGNNLPFGYAVDDKGYYIIKEDEAEIVRKIFEIYTTTSNGRRGVLFEMMKLGYNITYNQIAKILSHEQYTGRVLEAGSYRDRRLTGRYPAIISEETYDEAKRRRATNNSNAYKRDSYYFGRGLIRCADCGNVFAANNCNGWYVCAGAAGLRPDQGKCKNSTSIGINTLDTILWDCAVSEYIIANWHRDKAQKAELEAKISDLKKVIENTEERLAKVTQKAKRYSFLYGEGDIDDDEYAKKKEQIATERAQINADRVSSEERINLLQKMIDEQSVNLVDTIMNLSEEAFSLNELKEMCEIVHTYINKVEVTEDEKRYKFITIHTTRGSIYKYRARYAGRGGQRYWREATMPTMKSLSPWVEFTPNIIIRRRVAHLRKSMTKEFEIIKTGANSID